MTADRYSYFRSYGLDVTIVRPFLSWRPPKRQGDSAHDSAAESPGHQRWPDDLRRGSSATGITVSVTSWARTTWYCELQPCVVRPSIASGKDTGWTSSKYVARTSSVPGSRRDARPGRGPAFHVTFPCQSIGFNHRSKKFGASIAISIGPRISPNTHMSRTGLAVAFSSHTRRRHRLPVKLGRNGAERT